MMVSYKVIKERLESEKGVVYTAYGIKAVENGREIQRVSDIGCTYISVKKLCIRCNRLKLSPVHLHDVAEDFIAKV